MNKIKSLLAEIAECAELIRVIGAFAFYITWNFRKPTVKIWLPGDK